MSLNLHTCGACHRDLRVRDRILRLLQASGHRSLSTKAIALLCTTTTPSARRNLAALKKENVVLSWFGGNNRQWSAVIPTADVLLKVIVCGGRNFTDIDLVREYLGRLPAGTTVVHGAARGADALADAVALMLGLSIEPHPADWKKHGKAAGAIRNSEMLKAGNVALVIAFPGGRGTADMVAKARAAKVNVVEASRSDLAKRKEKHGARQTTFDDGSKAEG